MICLEKRNAGNWMVHDGGIHNHTLQVLVPFVPTICPVVDKEAGYIYMFPPRGLLDIAQPPPKKQVVIRGLLPLYGESSFWTLASSIGLDLTADMQLVPSSQGNITAKDKSLNKRRLPRKGREG